VPLVIPPFAQYQAPLFPLRGLWNNPPTEGDFFVNAEIDWLTNTSGLNAVQIALAGNSPVAFSQIVALSVDNGRCGCDVQFVFPDSGFVLQVPAYNQGVYPVLTNALMFYVVALGSIAASDVTVLQVLNSMPPPVAIQPALEQSITGSAQVALSVNASTVLVPAPQAGTIEAFNMNFTVNQTVNGACGVALRDGLGNVLWQSEISAAANVVSTLPISLSGLRLRFANGLNFVVTATSLTGGSFASVNVYYGQP
jgi:hypothetical protein